MERGWVGFDFDGTLAHYVSWDAQGNELGQPIAPMVELVKKYLDEGRDVRIVTARLAGRSIEDQWVQRWAIEGWCKEHIGRVLPITNCKDYAMEILYDDRVVAVEANTGKILGGPGVHGWD